MRQVHGRREAHRDFVSVRLGLDDEHTLGEVQRHRCQPMRSASPCAARVYCDTALRLVRKNVLSHVLNIAQSAFKFVAGRPVPAGLAHRLTCRDGCRSSIGISCNVIAGAAHDHVFAAWDRRVEVLALIGGL